ncbi:MAG: GNAT family N-acetyltransferase [Oscillospiraceae bacterium]|nr:GNAT family N-acetyltransferase [Oscillospiraceae bacterium]
MIIETERLYLREMTLHDFDALYSVLADSDIMEHYPYTFDDLRVRGWISRNLERYQIFGFGLWAVCLKSTGEMIGDCGLTMQNINGSIKPEIGYHIAKAHQRQGYAREAALACRDWAFENTPFKRIYSYMKKANIPSSATARAAGMQLVDEYTDNEGAQTVVYAIDRKDRQTVLHRNEKR